MSMSTGDVRRPSTTKSADAVASDGPEAEVVDDAPKGGVLPVKKAAKRAGAAGGAAAASKASSARASGARTTGAKAASAPVSDTSVTDEDAEVDESESASASTRGASSKSTPAKSVPANATASKATPAKATPARPAGAKVTSAKVAGSKAAGAKAGGSKIAGSKPAGSRAGGGRPGGPGSGRGPTGYGKNRKPMAPIRVSQGRNWGPIALYVITGVVAIGIVAFGAWKVIERDNQPTWQERAADIPGIHNYLVSNPEWFQVDPNVGNHKAGDLTYPSSPPVGGVHNPQWQSCMGDVYTSQIAKEQAVHALEHGAVWITYRPDLPQDQIDKLASKVRDVEYTMMSPYPGLDVPISLQAWGYQLKLENANDGRIDDFINALKKNATQEPSAGCSGGITDATVKPLDLPTG
jgi:hypothetical protein